MLKIRRDEKMFLDQYLNESNDMSEPILSESDINELESLESEEYISECFTEDEGITLLLLEAKELKLNNPKEIVKNIINKMIEIIDKIREKAIAFINKLRVNFYGKNYEKMHDYIKENINNLPNEYEFKYNGPLYNYTYVNKISIMIKELCGTLVYKLNKDSSVDDLYRSINKDLNNEYKDKADFVSTEKENDISKKIKDRDSIINFFNADNFSMYIKGYKKLTTKDIPQIKDKLIKTKRFAEYQNVSKQACVEAIKLVNRLEYIMRSNIMYCSALYKDLYNNLKKVIDSNK